MLTGAALRRPLLRILSEYHAGAAVESQRPAFYSRGARADGCRYLHPGKARAVQFEGQGILSRVVDDAHFFILPCGDEASELGAGKSEMARGIARGLGVTETVTSPSFTILNVYESGCTPLYQFDWYRLESEEELYELGMDEYLGGDGIALVEWPGRCPEAVPEDCLLIRLEAEGETTRRITSESRGAFRTILPDEA